MPPLNPFLWYRDKESLRIGGVSRYEIRYTNIDPNKTHIYFRLKNIERTTIRAIHLLNGPFILYCHVVPHNYDHRHRFDPEDPSVNKEILFENQIKPGQTFNVRLNLNENSYIGKQRLDDASDVIEYQKHELQHELQHESHEQSQHESHESQEQSQEQSHQEQEGFPVYGWSIDIISQIVITRNTSILYDFMIGDNIKEMRNINTGALQYSFSELNKIGSSLLSNGSNSDAQHHQDAIHENEHHYKNNRNDQLGRSNNPQLTVNKQLVADLWSTRPKHRNKPIHLVIVTHGIFSNLTADMLYLKDTLESNVAENVVVKGYKGNAGKTERGVKKLGTNVCNYVIDLIDTLIDQGYKIDKISFIGHSLGGVVQLYAIKNILLTQGTDFFSKRHIQPVNLVMMASPMLGVLSEMSFLISWFLDLGTLGKTGRDLTLSKRLPNLKQVKLNNNKDANVRERPSFKPLLETLPDEPLRSFMGQFKHLTLYANAINDGIVPLRTSALLYLDYEALGDVTQLQKKRHGTNLNYSNTDDSSSTSRSSSSDSAPKHDSNKNKPVEETQGANVSKVTNQDETDCEPDSKKDDAKPKSSVAGKYWDFFWLNFTSPFEKHHRQGLNEKQIDKLRESNEALPQNDVRKLDNKEVKFKGKQAMKEGKNKAKTKLTNREKKFLKITAKGSDYYHGLKKEDPHRQIRTDSSTTTGSSGASTVASPQLGKEDSEVGGLETEDNTRDFDNENNEDDEATPKLNIPPKASAVESAINTILCPIPSNEYIMDPESRDPIIFHDKYYHFDNIPSGADDEEVKGEEEEEEEEEQDKQEDGSHKHGSDDKQHHSKLSPPKGAVRAKRAIFNYNDWKLSKQVKIARKYHQPDMNWRKVLVSLPPDAHNNIVVRRRFANGYGWGVVDHLCRELFDQDDDQSDAGQVPGDPAPRLSTSAATVDTSEAGKDIGMITDEEAIKDEEDNDGNAHNAAGNGLRKKLRAKI